MLITLHDVAILVSDATASGFASPLAVANSPSTEEDADEVEEVDEGGGPDFAMMGDAPGSPVRLPPKVMELGWSRRVTRGVLLVCPSSPSLSEQSMLFHLL